MKLKARPESRNMEFSPFTNNEAQKISAEIDSKP